MAVVHREHGRHERPNPTLDDVPTTNRAVRKPCFVKKGRLPRSTGRLESPISGRRYGLRYG